MKLKRRLAIYFSLLFSILLGIVLLNVYYLFSHYRKEEFRLRLEEKAFSSIELLVDVKQIDSQILKLIGQNTINKLYNEKLIIFNDSLRLIYSSIDDAVIKWSKSDLKYLKANKTFYRQEKEYDVYGVMYRTRNHNYYALVAAEDIYGTRQLHYLGYLLLFAFVFGTTTIWLLSYYVSAKNLSALDSFKDKIAEISDKKLHIRLDENNKNDEIRSLAHSFNQMMDRIDQAYKQQKEFTDNASHELRTPVTRIITQINNLIKREKHSEETLRYLNSILSDTNQMADIISSLLLLTKIEQENINNYMPLCRIDEVLFEAMQDMQKSYPDFHINFDIENVSDDEINIEVKGDGNLLKIVFTNLLKNAYNYSSDKQTSIILRPQVDSIELIFTNHGPVLNEAERNNIFKAFVRGSNSLNKSGIGLGLRIVERILSHHSASIQYDSPNENLNRFIIFFKL